MLPLLAILVQTSNSRSFRFVSVWPRGEGVAFDYRPGARVLAGPCFIMYPIEIFFR